MTQDKPDPSQKSTDDASASGVFDTLSLSLSLLGEIFNHLPEAVVVADVERRMTYVNPAAEQLFGYSADELLGNKTAMLYASKDDFTAQGKERYNPAAKARMGDYRVAYRRSDGTPFLGATTGGAMQDVKGDVRGFIGIIQAARSEERALDSLQRLHAAITNASLDHTGRIEAMLRLGAEHFGLEFAIQSRIENNEYLVEHCVDPHGNLQSGMIFDTSGTYCVHTLEAGQPTGFHYAGGSEIRTHPCYRNFGLEAYIGSTIHVNGEVYGTLNFSAQEACEPFTRDDLVLIQLLADTVGYQISQEKLRKELQEQAETDELTGLARRRSIIHFLEWELADSQRSGRPVAIIAIDLDHFKQINDTWGHSAGDRALESFARIVAQQGREIDLCGRLGGEEFLVVLSDTDNEGGRIVAERLRQAMAAEPVEVEPQTWHTLKASMGVASYRPGESVENLLARADRSVYTAKKGGRDKVCIESDVDEGSTERIQ